MKYHVIIHWSSTNNWSGIRESRTPEEALRESRASVARKSGVSEEFLDRSADFLVKPWPPPIPAPQ